MANYCQSCGAVIDSSASFCPSCGAAVNGSGGNSSAVKTAATVGGVVLGAAALSGLARSLTHRRRRPYMDPPPPRGPMHGPGGPRGGPHGGPGGPGGPGGGGRR